MNLLSNPNGFLQNILGKSFNLESEHEKLYKNLTQKILLFLIENLEKEKERKLKVYLISFLNRNEVLPNDPVDRFIYLLEIFSNENLVLVNLNINQEEFQYSDTFEWGMNNIAK